MFTGLLNILLMLQTNRYGKEQIQQGAITVAVVVPSLTFVLYYGSGVSGGGVCRGGVAAQSGARTSKHAAGHHRETGPKSGPVQSIPHCFLSVPSETGILSLPVPAAAVHDGTVLFVCFSSFVQNLCRNVLTVPLDWLVFIERES